MTRKLLPAIMLLAIAVTGCGRDDARPSATNESVATYGPLTPANAPHPNARPAAAPAKSKPVASPSPKPAILQRRIPFPAKRRAEMAAYSQRHYGDSSYRLEDPSVIVEHFTSTPSVAATYDIFARDVADVELHELPQVCSHFVIGEDGAINQLVPLGLRCRHTVGLNDEAIGIEHVGNSDAELLRNRVQLRASVRLTGWLQCRFGIKRANVIGHNESLSSPYHHENVASLRTQTHDDLKRASMQVYRRHLGRQAC